MRDYVIDGVRIGVRAVSLPGYLPGAMFAQRIRREDILEVDIGPFGPGQVSIGVTHLDAREPEGVRVSSAIVTGVECAKVFGYFDRCAYPARSFGAGGAMTPARLRLEELVRDRGSLSAVRPSELYA